MEGRLEELLFLRWPAMEDVQSFLNGIYSRDELLKSAALPINTVSSSENTTHILEIISSHDPSKFNIFVAVALLHTQSKYMIPSLHQSFFLCTMKVVTTLTGEMIRVLKKELPSITRTITNIAFESEEDVKFVFPLMRHVAEMISSVHGTLSPVHVDVLKLAMKGAFYSLALGFIESQDILEVDSNNSELTAEDALHYFYYVGLCYIEAKNYRRALGHFITVLCVPALSLSTIIEECLKKCKLLALMVHGREFEIPKHASQIILSVASNESRGASSSSAAGMAQLKLDTAIYDNFAKLYTSTISEYSTLNTFVESHGEIFERDGNMALVQAVVAAWQRKKLHELADTFVTLTLTEVSSAIGAASEEETEHLLAKTVEEEHLLAYIDRKERLVVFTEFSEENLTHVQDAELNNKNMLLMKELQNSMQTLTYLGNRIRAAQAEGLVSQEYIVKTTTNSGSVRGSVATSSIMDF